MKRRFWLVLALLVASAIGLFGQAVSLASRHWTSFNRVSLANAPDGVLQFVFPVDPTKHIGYLWTTQGPTVLAGTLTLRVRVETIGFPTFRYDTEPSNTCVSPARVRPFFARYVQKVRKLPYSSRWWPRDAYLDLQAGEAETSVPLDDSLAVWVPTFSWSNFDDDRQDVDLVGLSFGGGCFYAHGVYVTGGDAAFTIVEMTIGSKAGHER